MQYFNVDYHKLRTFCEHVFCAYGFSEEESSSISDVLLDADLSGIESHGIQRLIRYHNEFLSGMVKLGAKPEIVFETPLSAVVDAKDAMGQLVGVEGMKLAIEKAKKSGFGMVTVRNSNHYGIAGYYAKMAANEGLIGLSMTNSEAIMVPTFGREPMLGTNPIAFAMPASPTNYLFDGATTVVPRGKLEVYFKRGKELPDGWAIDENGNKSTDAELIINNIIGKNGGGILPLGGWGELNSGYKGYGYGMLCEITTSILSGGLTSNYINRKPGRGDISHCFIALDYGMFGDKAEIEARLSKFLQEVRDSEKADGCERIYIQGEKEYESHVRVMAQGVSLNEKTYSELEMISRYTHTEEFLPALDK